MYYFIVNPHSRSGKGLDIWNKLKLILNEKNVPYEVYLTEHVGHATKLTAAISSPSFQDQEEKTIVALGGDGTLNEVLNGLRISSNITLGYIPSGSGNDFCRGMKLSKNPRRALKHMLDNPQYGFLDYGIVSYNDDGVPSHKRFIVSSGLGFDADVCANLLCSPLKKALNTLNLGKLSYVFIGIKRIILCKGASGYIIIDEEKKIPLKKIRFISFQNMKYEGGGFCFAPKAVPDDGMFNICCVSDCSKLHLTKILIAGLFGRHESIQGVRSYFARHASIHLDSPYVVHTDGEIIERQIDISVQSECKKIRFVC